MARTHTDAVGDPVVCIAAGQAKLAANQIDKPATLTGLVVKPHTRLGTTDHDREAALAAPTPFLAGL